MSQLLTEKPLNKVDFTILEQFHPPDRIIVNEQKFECSNRILAKYRMILTDFHVAFQHLELKFDPKNQILLCKNNLHTSIRTIMILKQTKPTTTTRTKNSSQLYTSFICKRPSTQQLSIPSDLYQHTNSISTWQILNQMSNQVQQYLRKNLSNTHSSLYKIQFSHPYFDSPQLQNELMLQICQNNILSIHTKGQFAINLINGLYLTIKNTKAEQVLEQLHFILSLDEEIKMTIIKFDQYARL